MGLVYSDMRSVRRLKEDPGFLICKQIKETGTQAEKWIMKEKAGVQFWVEITCKSSRWGWFTLGTINTLGHISLCCTECPVRCRVVISIPGLTPPTARSATLPIMEIKNVPSHCQMLPAGQSCSLWGITEEAVDCSSVSSVTGKLMIGVSASQPTPSPESRFVEKTARLAGQDEDQFSARWNLHPICTCIPGSHSKCQVLKMIRGTNCCQILYAQRTFSQENEEKIWFYFYESFFLGVITSQ
jgi:hypothetical protein